VQEHDTDSTVYVGVLLWWELYSRECGEDLTECEEWRALIVRRFSVQEHDTNRAVTVIALLWNVSFTNIFIYICIQYNLLLITVIFSVIF
jgi:hypothetical protein